MSDTAVAVVEQQPKELSIIEVKNQVEKIQNLMKDLMVEGEHYGKSFPGDTKKNLLKPGADKICFMFRLRPQFRQEISKLPNGHMEVITGCEIYHIDSGLQIAQGLGMATTMESKYRWRNAAKKCPVCGKETIKKSKYDDGGWYCYAKIGGCGAKFADDDPAIKDQVVGKVENPDIADQYNTVLKISKKRAYVDATITATAASDIFSQDADDLLSDDEPAPRNVTPENLAEQAAGRDRANPTNEGYTPSTSRLPQKTTQNQGNGSEKTDRSDGNPPLDIQAEEKRLIADTGRILNSLSPDELPYFTDAEVAQERAIADGSRTLQNFKNQNMRLAKELEKRKAAYKPIPFGDDVEPTIGPVTQEDAS